MRHSLCLASFSLLGVAALSVTACTSRTFGEVPSRLEADPRFNKTECDVIIAGGSTAALSAAIAAAEESPRRGTRGTLPGQGPSRRQHICLIEPTDWPGGQLTSSMVSAIDFSHQKDGKGRAVGPSDNNIQNNSTLFHKWINDVGAPRAICWVTSSGCFEPVNMLRHNINPTITQLERSTLTVYRNSVVKRVEKTGRNISSVTFVQRKARSGSGYERFFSQDVEDWYTETDSPQFTKTTVTLTGREGRTPVVIDATELGDVLVLSGASYLQGVEDMVSSKMDDTKDLDSSGTGVPYVRDKYGQSRVGNRPPWGTKNPPATCPPPPAGDGACRGYDEAGQMIVYPFIARLNSQSVPDNSPASVVVPANSQAVFQVKDDATWDSIWRYRRIKGAGAKAQAGDLSLQNFNPGNDYPFGYHLLSMEETEAQKADWKGGVNVETLRGAEIHSIGWFRFLRAKAPGSFRNAMDLDKAGAGTGHGLAKMPYLRDTRRSIGVNNFVLKYRHLAEVSPNGVTAHPFSDAIAIGSYVVDIHPPMYYIKPMPTTNYLSLINTYPYFIPYRALTNRDVDNLLVAGKTMAQTFHANAAIRLQPQEWRTGAAAGLIAVYLSHHGFTTSDLVGNADRLKEVRDALQGAGGRPVYSRVQWTLSGQVFPN